jgi:hypothetical protein
LTPPSWARPGGVDERVEGRRLDEGAVRHDDERAFLSARVRKRERHRVRVTGPRVDEDVDSRGRIAGCGRDE